MDPTGADLKGIGVVVAGVAILLKIILPYVMPNKQGEELRKHYRKIEDLHVWHNHEAKPGVMNWWILEEDRECWNRTERKLDDLLDRLPRN